MRTTLVLDDKLVLKAGKLTGLKKKTLLVHKGLESLIGSESARRLAALAGTERSLVRPRRRRGM